MDKRVRVVVSVCGVILVVLAIVLLMLFEPWQLYPDQDMNFPNSAGGATVFLPPVW